MPSKSNVKNEKQYEALKNKEDVQGARREDRQRSRLVEEGRQGRGNEVLSRMPLKSPVLACTLKKSPADSSAEVLGSQLLEQLESVGVSGRSSGSWTTTGGSG